MITFKQISSRAEKIDKKAQQLSEEMSKHEYTIEETKLNPPLKKMWRIVRRMGFTNDQTDRIISSVKKDLVGKK